MNDTTPVNQTTPAAPVQPVAVVAAPAIGLKELLIPISIVIAGALVGVGLFMSGGTSSATPTSPVAAAPAPTQPTTNTDAVRPVEARDHVKGPADAPITIVEYSDFDCPFCARFHTSMNQLVSAPDAQVKWVYRHFPLEQLHPEAATVAHASECVAELAGNDAFWKFTDAYYAARGAGDATAHQTLITRLATDAGVSAAPFGECMESGRHTEVVQNDLNNAVETGGRGTPWSILIGPTGKTYPINGALTAPQVQQLITLALEEA